MTEQMREAYETWRNRANTAMEVLLCNQPFPAFIAGAEWQAARAQQTEQPVMEDAPTREDGGRVGVTDAPKTDGVVATSSTQQPAAPEVVEVLRQFMMACSGTTYPDEHPIHKAYEAGNAIVARIPTPQAQE